MRSLTTRQAKFVEEYTLCGCGAEAARRAGYSEKTAKEIGSRLLTKPPLKRAIEARKAAYRESVEITRGDVVSGVLSAILLAQEKGDAGAQLRGWVELARLLGFYDQTVEKPVVSAQSAKLMAKLAGMSDAALLSVATGAR